MAAQVVHGIDPGDTVHKDSEMRGAPWSCGVHNRAGLSWLPLLWGSCSTPEHNRNNGSCGYFSVVLSYDVISSVGINSWGSETVSDGASPGPSTVPSGEVELVGVGGFRS